MELNVKFEENDLNINTDFKAEVYQISDGGFEKGYNEGYDKGYDSGYNVGTNDGYDKGFIEGEKSVFDLGKICRSFTCDLNAFNKKEVVLNLDNLKTLDSTFYEKLAENVNTTVEYLTINCQNEITTCIYAFRSDRPYDYTLKHITLNVKSSNSATWNYVFAGRKALEIIDGEPLNIASEYTANMFQSCSSLKEVRIVPNCVTYTFNIRECPLLSKESIESVINGLSSEVSGFNAQLSLKAVNKAFETSEGANDGRNSTEWQNLVETKSNWTIALK